MKSIGKHAQAPLPEQKLRHFALRAVALFLLLTIVSCESGASNSSASKAVSARPDDIRLYDDDAGHLWNRIASALNTWTSKQNGKSIYLEDPLLWPNDELSLTGECQRAALPLLDDFLMTHGERLVTSPIKRAIFQSNLWLLYDWASAVRETGLRKRLAAIMRRVALSTEEIASLPDLYALGVNSQSNPAAFDADRPDAPFLPGDLFEPKGPWVLLGDGEGADRKPLARFHLDFFGGRASFLIFLRVPGTRDDTLRFLALLRDDRAGENGRTLPPGAQLALVRRMFLVDASGRLTPSPIVESVQIRVYGDFPGGHKIEGLLQRFVKFELRRKELFANQERSLQAFEQDSEEPMYFALLGTLNGDSKKSAVPFVRPLGFCSRCHLINAAVESHSRAFLTHVPRPKLATVSIEEEERRAIAHKSELRSRQLLASDWKEAK